MKNYLQSVSKTIYALVEQFVFYLAAIAGFVAWVSLGNIYIAGAIFIIICVLFWALPSMLKREK